ncbi:MAG: hypothetical protein NTX54_04595 [Chloroflexi bacterium]|nr:hypothetical protein [Chloroflexota bacterium]
MSGTSTRSGLTSRYRVGVIQEAGTLLRPNDGARSRDRTVATSLLVATVIALVLRTAYLGSVPTGMDGAEAKVAFNAWLIGLTGKDEYGTFLGFWSPRNDGYGLPLFTLAAVPFTAILGPTTLAVRLPAALAGALTAGPLGILALRLTGSRISGIGAGGLLAISVWHLQISRTGDGASLGLLALIVAVLTVIEVTRRQSGTRNVVSHVSLGLMGIGCVVVAALSHPATMAVTPFVMALASMLRWSRGTRALTIATGATRPLLVCLVVASTAASVFSWSTHGSAATDPEPARNAREVIVEATVARRVGFAAPPPPFEGLAGFTDTLQSPTMVSARVAIDAYASVFDPTFLFTRGDANRRRHVGEGGQSGLLEVPLLATGLWMLLVSGNWRRPGWALTAGWLLLAPIPVALTLARGDSSSAVAMIPALIIVEAAGLVRVLQFARHRKLTADLAIVAVAGMATWALSTFVHDRQESARAWQGGTIEAYRHAWHDVHDGIVDEVIVTPPVDGSYRHANVASVGVLEGSTRPSPIPPVVRRNVDWGSELTDPASRRRLYAIDGPARVPAGYRSVFIGRGEDGRAAVQLIARGS